MTSDDFLIHSSDGMRTKIVQDLFGLRQTEFAASLGHFDGRLVRYWQSNTHRKDPGPENLSAIAAKFGFLPHFFMPRATSELAQPLFHKLASTTEPPARRARGYLQLVAEVAAEVTERGEMARPSLQLLDGAESIEAARVVREQLHLGSSPVRHVIRSLEARGVAVAFAPLDARAVFSYSDTLLGRPIIAYNAASGDRYAGRYWICHELGHIVMHGRISRQRKADAELEKEANEFAAEFLMPASVMVDEFEILRASGVTKWKYPTDVPWRAILDLKETWGVEMSSVLLRAHDLGVIDDAEYALAMRQYGRKVAAFKRRNSVATAGTEFVTPMREPGRHASIEVPRALQGLLDSIARAEGTDYLAGYLGIPTGVMNVIGSVHPVHLELPFAQAQV